VATEFALRLGLFGGFRIHVDQQPMARLPSVRQQQLIAFLILNARKGPIPRQRASAALWPESTDVQAQTNLRRELHHLREGWPAIESLIETGSRTFAWRGDPSTVIDVIAFEDAVARATGGDLGALREAAALYQGDLLPDCTEDWIAGDRERLRLSA